MLSGASCASITRASGSVGTAYPVKRILRPEILADQMDLRAADIIPKRAGGSIFQIFDANGGNLAQIHAALLAEDIFLSHVLERPVGYRHKSLISVQVLCRSP